MILVMYVLVVRIIKWFNLVVVGIIVWFGSEVMFFVGFFVIYFIFCSIFLELWVDWIEFLNVLFVVVNMVIFVFFFFMCQMGVFVVEDLQFYKFGKGLKNGVGCCCFFGWGMVEWFFFIFVFGVIFVFGQVWEYVQFVVEGMLINVDFYVFVFYLMIGFYVLYVIGGFVVFLFVIGCVYVVKNFWYKEVIFLIVVFYYWYFVDVVWIVLFFVIYFLK